MKSSFKYIFCSIIIIIIGCTPSSPTHHHPESEQVVKVTADSTAAEAEVVLSTEQLARIGVTYVEPQQRNLRNRVKINGFAELPPEYEAHLSSYLEGKVTSILVKPGQAVQQGQVLLLLTNPALLDLQRELDEALLQRQFYQLEKERLQRLVQLDPGQQRALEEANLHWARSDAQQSALTKKLLLINVKRPENPDGYASSFPVVAPLSGFIKDIGIHIGEYVTTSQKLLTLVNLNHLHWEGKLSARYLNTVKPGQTLDLQLLQNPGKVYPIKIYSVGPMVDATNHTFTLHAELPINAEIKPGMFLEGWINTQNDDVWSVPSAALLRDRGLEYLIIQGQEQNDQVHFSKVPVKTGIQDGAFVEINWLNPVKGNPKIVVEGAFFINAEVKKREGSTESEHEH